LVMTSISSDITSNGEVVKKLLKKAVKYIAPSAVTTGGNTWHVVSNAGEKDDEKADEKADGLRAASI
jgi:hypothetical protein